MEQMPKIANFIVMRVFKSMQGPFYLSMFFNLKKNRWALPKAIRGK
jgi:hypothetical protein